MVQSRKQVEILTEQVRLAASPTAYARHAEHKRAQDDKAQLVVGRRCSACSLLRGFALRTLLIVTRRTAHGGRGSSAEGDGRRQWSHCTTTPRSGASKNTRRQGSTLPAISPSAARTQEMRQAFGDSRCGVAPAMAAGAQSDDRVPRSSGPLLKRLARAPAFSVRAHHRTTCSFLSLF